MEDQIEQLIKLTQKLLKSNKTLYGYFQISPHTLLPI